MLCIDISVMSVTSESGLWYSLSRRTSNWLSFVCLSESKYLLTSLGLHRGGPLSLRRFIWGREYKSEADADLSNANSRTKNTLWAEMDHQFSFCWQRHNQQPKCKMGCHNSWRRDREKIKYLNMLSFIVLLSKPYIRETADYSPLH